MYQPAEYLCIRDLNCCVPKLVAQDYKYVGVINGKFYDAEGKAVLEKAKFIERMLFVAEAEEQAKKRNKKAAPNCRKRWT